MFCKSSIEHASRRNSCLLLRKLKQQSTPTTTKNQNLFFNSSSHSTIQHSNDHNNNNQNQYIRTYSNTIPRLVKSSGDDDDDEVAFVIPSGNKKVSKGGVAGSKIKEKELDTDSNRLLKKKGIMPKSQLGSDSVVDDDDDDTDDDILNANNIDSPYDLDTDDFDYNNYYNNPYSSDTTNKIKTSQEEEYEAMEKDYAKRQVIRDELDQRTGRLWTDPLALTDDDWSSGRTLGDLMDWTPDLCSRLSLERVKVYEDGIPTMEKLSTLSSKLPPSPPPHPALGNPKPYNQHRKQQIYQTIYTTVSNIVKPQVDKILSMQNWNEKQDAIDELFDTILHRIKYDHLSEEDGYTIVRKSSTTNPTDEQEVDDYIPVVLGSQPDFHKLVERALEEYLRNVVKEEKKLFENSASPAATTTSSTGANSIPTTSATTATTTSATSPIFMDLLHGKDPSKSVTNGVPDILYPLQPHPKDGPGKMIEEWELAANEDTKRIMIRQCIVDIAKSLSDNSTSSSSNTDKSRVYVKGRRGAGKSSALAAIVASARKSGHIVFYLPDGARLSKLGFYNEFNAHRSTSVDDIDGQIYDLPLLSQEVCSVLLNSHEKDMNQIMVPNQYLDEYFSADLLQKLYTNLNIDQSDGGIPINSILKVGNENLTFASACYGAAIQTLMNQSKTPFTIVLDDFNCYFDQGHYYNEKYDSKVKRAIPTSNISLFKPLLDAMGVAKNKNGMIVSKPPKAIQRGGIVVGISESHAVGRVYTDALTSTLQEDGVCTIVDVPQYSPEEVEHILANFEIIGIGRLRFDRGETVMNKQEVAFLRMVSGSVGQKLLDACVN